jgi:hypothetical protein
VYHSRAGALSASVSLVVLTVAGITLACSGGEDSARQPTTDELPYMVLTQEDLGAAYQGFESSAEGPNEMTNEEVIAQSFDPADDQTDIERFGRETGWASSFTSESASAGREGTYYRGISSLPVQHCRWRS